MPAVISKSIARVAENKRASRTSTRVKPGLFAEKLCL